MDPTLEEKQNDQPQQKQPKEGSISQGINTINNFARKGFTNPLGKISSRVVAQTALRGLTAFLGSTSGVWIPIVIAIAIVFVFTFIIVGFGSAPFSATNNQSINPTQPTLPPAAP